MPRRDQRGNAQFLNLRRTLSSIDTSFRDHPMNSYSQPVILRHGLPLRSLERIPVGSSGAGEMSEATLQQALFTNPQALPIGDIDASYGTLIPLCTELSTDSGRVDILYASSQGRLVLVETKLWRNPQARREVVAQILDYAAQLTHWSYEDLDARVSLSCKEPPGYLMRTVKQVMPGLDEASFVDTLSASLRRGEFLLLIAGDGIRQGAESLVTLLERTGHFRFKLALVEVAAYRLSAGEILLQPRVIARTEIIERHLLLMGGEPVELAEAATTEELPEPESLAAQRARYSRFWSEFLAKMASIDAVYRGVKPARSTNQYFAMPPTATASWVSAFVSKTRGEAGVYYTTSKNLPEAEQIFELLVEQITELSEEIGCQLKVETNGNGDGKRRMLFCESLPYVESTLDAPDADWLASLAQRTVRTIQALTPRINSVIRSVDS